MNREPEKRMIFRQWAKSPLEVAYATRKIIKGKFARIFFGKTPLHGYFSKYILEA